MRKKPEEGFLIPATRPSEVVLPPHAEVVCGDFFEVAAGWGDGAFDHVITDPPYSEKTHSGAQTTNGIRSFSSGREIKKLVEFSFWTDEEFLRACRECIRLARRWVVMTCDWRHAAVADRELAEFVRLGIWVKPDATPQFTGDRPAMGWEAVLMLHRPGRKRWNGGGSHAVWTCKLSRDKRHPTQKPVALVRQWVREFTDPGEHVLDPFAGSGTTGVACLTEGRRVTLVERDPKWAGDIRLRLNRPF